MTATAADDPCMQFYQQQPLMDGIMALDPSIEELMDATMSSSSDGTSLSPNNSQNTTVSGHNQLTPKGGTFKPIRKRSRASKRTPTTLLKANTSNFRALVQQFTGNPTTTAMSLSIHKGPITLNFQQNKQHNIHHHRHHTKRTTRAMPPFGTISCSNHQISIPWQRQAEQVPMQEQQISGYRLEQAVMKSSNFVPTSGNSYSCMDDGFLFANNDFSLHELNANTISSDIDGFFM